MTAVIYARYSSDNQTELSIEAQVRACTEYAAKKNITVVNLYKDEAMTGRNANRPGYQSMLADAFEGKFDIILCHKYDRIARDLEEQASLDKRLEKLGIRLIAVAQDYGEGKDAKLSKGIQWVLGEYYSANLSEEVKKGLKEIALKGLFTGGVPPFGYDIVDQKYVINDIEAYWVREMFTACINGTGYTNIIEQMADLGITGKRGKPIKYTQIYEILRNEKYTGVYIYSLDEEKDRNLRRSKPNAIRIEDCFPKIITREIFEKANKILSERKRGPAYKHRCSGIVYCGNCGAKMHFTRSTRKGHEYRNFVCSAKCGIGVVPASFVDEAVDAYLDNLFSEKNISDVDSAIRKLRREQSQREKTFEQMKAKRIAKKQKEIENIMQALASGSFADNYELCNAMIIERKDEIRSLEDQECPVIPDAKIRSWLDDVKESRQTPKTFIEKIVIKKTEANIYSAFASVLGIIGCGGAIDSLPKTLYGCKYNKLERRNVSRRPYKAEAFQTENRLKTP